MKQVVTDRPHNEIFQGLPPGPKRAIREALAQLSIGEAGLDVARLQGTGDPPLMRLRVGSFRVAFFETDQHFVVTRIFHRSIGYDWLDDGEEGAP